MRLNPVPTIIVLIGASAAVNAVEIAPANQKLTQSPATVVADKHQVGTPVTVTGINVVPAGNLGSADGKMKVNLKGLVGVGYDSNLFATDTDVKQDEYLRAVAGVEAVYRIDDRFGLGADVMLDSQTFEEFDERNLLGGSARVRGAYKGETLTGNLVIDYALIDDPLIQTGERIKREVYGGSTAWLRETASGGIVINADAHRTEYLEDQDGFVAEDRNVDEYIAGVRYIHQQNDRTSYWARVGFGASVYDTDNRLQDAASISGAVGVDLAWGDRATVFAEAGVDSRTYKDEFATDYDDKEILAPVANLGLHYPINDSGSVATARVFTDARNSLSANAMQVTGITLDGRHPMGDRLTAVGNVSAAMLSDYGSQDNSERDSIYGSLGAEYKMIDGMVLRGTVRYTQSEAKLDAEEDYDRFEGVVETAFAF